MRKYYIYYVIFGQHSSEIVDEVQAREQAIIDVKAQIIQQTPLFANNIEECIDTSKVYVLPDGYIYAYIKKNVSIPHNAGDEGYLLNTSHTANASMDATRSRAGTILTEVIEVDNSWSDCIVNMRGIEKFVENYFSTFYIVYYDANGGWLGYVAASTFGFSNTEQPLPISVDAATQNYWANTKYIRVMCSIKAASISVASADVENLVINFERLNKVETRYSWQSTGHAFVPADYEERIVDLEEIVPELQEDVEQLKKAVGTSPSNSGAVWYAVGDSITKGYGVGADNCWVKYVKQYNGYDAEKSKNLGISGLGFAKSDPNYSKTARTVVDENSFAEVDLVTVAIGINDWKEPFSIDTVKSEMRYCFEKILTDNPYCKIIFIVPFNMRNKGSASTNWALGYSGSDVTGGTLQNFIDTQKSVCEEYGIQIIDMTNNSVINKKNITTLLYDGIHPDAECHKALGRELARRITFA